MPLSLDHVNCIYATDTNHPVHALDDICLTLEDGQFIGLIGHTGCGKSTLVQHLNGLLKPTSGTITFDGEDIHARDYDRRALRGKVGLVFQYPEHQLFETDVLADVCFGPKNLGLDKDEIEKRAREALLAVGMTEEEFGNSPFELSGGQKRRVAIAGVLAMQPRVLILDEPTAGLDPAGREEILELTAKLHHDNHMTVILVSHSMDDVANYVERLLVMDRGRVKYDDVPKEVFKHVKELEDMGLALPEITYVMRSLKRHRFDVDETTTTIEDACEQIMNLYRMRKAPMDGQNGSSSEEKA